MSAEELIAIAQRHYPPGDSSRKGDRLLRVYGKRLEGVRRQPIALLELGVRHGASLRLWRDYFPNATIVGLDIEPVPRLDLPNVHVFQGDQTDPWALDRTRSAIGGGQFDVIIDDASHLGLKSKASFAHLFYRSLKASGLYFVEDIAAPLLKDWPDGAPFASPEQGSLEGYQHGMVGFLKQLIDEMADAVVRASRQSLIAEVAFYPNICVIRKAGDAV